MRNRLEALEKLAGDTQRLPMLAQAKAVPALVAGLLALLREIVDRLEPK